MAEQIKQKKKDFELAYSLGMVNYHNLGEDLNRYWWFSVIEGVFVVIIVLLQVEAIRSLLIPRTVI